MKISSLSKVFVVVLAGVLALGSLSLLGCSGGGTAGADTIDVTVVVDISAAIEEKDATALEVEKTLGAENTIEVKIPVDGTIMDALDASGVTYETTSSSMGDYVSSISGIASGSVGPESGWTYLVNDEMVMVSANEATLQAGDKVTWEFVTSWE